MLNTRHLVYPTPSDGNLRPNSDGLAMLREGTNDLTRFFFHKGLPKQKINNRTGDTFNHARSTGGYNSGGATILPDHVITANSKGGIVPFPPLPSKQSIKDENSNNPVPLISALIDWRLNPQISQIVDRPIPPQLNPIAVPH